MDIEFDFKGDPVGGVITKCKLAVCVYFFVYSGYIQSFLLHVILSNFYLMAFCVHGPLITFHLLSLQICWKR